MIEYDSGSESVGYESEPYPSGSETNSEKVLYVFQQKYYFGLSVGSRIPVK